MNNIVYDSRFWDYVSIIYTMEKIRSIVDLYSQLDAQRSAIHKQLSASYTQLDLAMAVEQELEKLKTTTTD